MKSEWKTGSKAGTITDNFLKKSLNSNYFTYQQIFEMLVPLIMDQFFVSIIGLLTTAMISSSSQESVSAVSLVSPIYAMTYAIFSSISAAGTVIIAQYKGNGNMNMVKKAAGQIVMFTVVSAIFFSIVLSFFAGSLIDAMFADADICVKNKATEYLIGCAISCIFLSLYMGCVAVFRGIGQTKICLKLSMIINLIHLFASFIFINILQLDIIGTSLSLNLARVIGGGVALYCLLGEKSGLGIRLKDIMRINGSILTSVIQTSIPFAMEQLCFNGGAILVSMFIVKLGTKSVAANAVANSTVAVFYAMGLAVSNLAVPVVGQCIGAGDRRMAKNYGKKMIWLGEFSILLSLAVMAPFLKLILGLYRAPADTIGDIYKLLVIITLPMVLFWSTSNVLPNVLRAAGDVKFTSYVSLGVMWIVRVGLSYLVSIKLGAGIVGVWICLGMEWLIRSIIFLLRFHSEKWLKTLF